MRFQARSPWPTQQFLPVRWKLYLLAYWIADEAVLGTYKAVIFARVAAYGNHEIIRRPNYWHQPVRVCRFAVLLWQLTLLDGGA
ncbi:hypothetical protein ACFLTV_02405, partial [Chloroflexota bacterium]